jgi:hypothetical protein
VSTLPVSTLPVSTLPVSALPVSTLPMTALPEPAVPVFLPLLVRELKGVPAPINPVVVEAPVMAAGTKVRGPFCERLSYFCEWLHARGLVQGLFVLDKDGALLFDDGDHDRLHFMARSLALATNRSTDGAGHVQMKIGSTSLLEVVPVETVDGRMVLGLLVERPLNSMDITPLTTALQQAVATPQQ